MPTSLLPEGSDYTETLRGAIHRGRHMANHHTTLPCEKTVRTEVTNILTPNLDLEITQLIAMSDFAGVPTILKIVTDKKNHNALSINTLINIMSYLQILGAVPKDIRKLREFTSKLLETKRKISGVA